MRSTAKHLCVNSLPLATWEQSLQMQADEEIQNWVNDVDRHNRGLLTSAYYRTYYRMSRKELARRGVIK